MESSTRNITFAAYAYASFHERFIKGRITPIGCPKLDNVDYAEKLTEIIRSNDIKDVTIVLIEVSCCGGLENAAKKALQTTGKFSPCVTLLHSIFGTRIWMWKPWLLASIT